MRSRPKYTIFRNGRLGPRRSGKAAPEANSGVHPGYGLVYDVDTCKIEVVVPAAPPRHVLSKQLLGNSD